MVSPARWIESAAADEASPIEMASAKNSFFTVRSNYPLAARSSRSVALTRLVVDSHVAFPRRTIDMAPNPQESLLPKTPILPHLLRGQKAIVTGASSGIGKAVAIALGAAGADVVVNYVGGEAPAGEVVKTITAAGGRAIAVQCDVSQEEQVVAMFQKTIKEFGTVDILVNNAGL